LRQGRRDDGLAHGDGVSEDRAMYGLIGKMKVVPGQRDALMPSN
jgi:hypothetical protein